MTNATRVTVGLDVHKDTIAVYWLLDDRPQGEEREIVNTPAAIRKLFKRLMTLGEVRACYEAGPCGYEVRRQLEAMGVGCQVIAPSLIPRRSGDRVKTDRRDARKLARLYRAGELSPIHVPTEAEEALRDLLRAREDVGEDLTRARHRLSKYLLRHGRIWREGKQWTQRHWQWLRAQHFEDATAERTLQEYLTQVDFLVERVDALDVEIATLASREPWAAAVGRLRCLRGIQILSAMTLIAEIVDFHRFASARELMSFVGLTPGVHASGGTVHTRPITKSGNAHARRVLVEAAWHYRHRPQLPRSLRKRTEGQPEAVHTEASRAQTRLNQRFWRLAARGKPTQVAVVAVARELVGFVWALMVRHAPPRGCAA